jgi:hypothetical protein
VKFTGHCHCQWAQEGPAPTGPLHPLQPRGRVRVTSNLQPAPAGSKAGTSRLRGLVPAGSRAWFQPVPRAKLGPSSGRCIVWSAN